MTIVTDIKRYLATAIAHDPSNPENKETPANIYALSRRHIKDDMEKSFAMAHLHSILHFALSTLFSWFWRSRKQIASGPLNIVQMVHERNQANYARLKELESEFARLGSKVAPHSAEVETRTADEVLPFDI